MPKRKIDLWLDDKRPAPEGWVHVDNVYDAIKWLKRGEVRRASLDHDLGANTKTGYDLCLWMANYGKWPDECPTVHSSNPVGREAMLFVIRRWFGMPRQMAPYPSEKRD